MALIFFWSKFNYNGENVIMLRNLIKLGEKLIILPMLIIKKKIYDGEKNIFSFELLF